VAREQPFSPEHTERFVSGVRERVAQEIERGEALRSFTGREQRQQPTRSREEFNGKCRRHTVVSFGFDRGESVLI
jgi:hypothetical protein